MFERVYVMPLVIGITPTTGLALPGIVPLVQREQPVGGVLRWAVPEWNKAEFERVEEAAHSVTRASQGAQLEDYVMALAQAVANAIPNREFHLEVSNFGVNYIPERRKR